MENLKISVVIPVYKGEEFLKELTERILASCVNSFDETEIILVNDASPDNSLAVIESLCRQHSNIMGINLSRNFGQHYAITAGLRHSSGDWISVMDCDLQDQPEEIPNLFAKTKEGYDIVMAQRKQRNDSKLKKLSSWLFYKVFGYLTDSRQDPSIANFGIYNRKAIDAVLAMGDGIRYFPTMIQWVGFRRTNLEVKHSGRASGKSSYNLHKLLKLAFNNMIAFSDKPLYLTIVFGFSIVVFSFVLGLYYLLTYLAGDIEVSGFTTLVISISFFSGIIIAILGILGIYLGKTFDQVKDRPVYIIDRIINPH